MPETTPISLTEHEIDLLLSIFETIEPYVGAEFTPETKALIAKLTEAKEHFPHA